MEMLDPLSPESLELLERADSPEPPSGAEERVFLRLAAALPPLTPSGVEGGGVEGSAGVGTATRFGRFGVPVALASLVVGLVAGFLLHLAFTPEPVAPPAPPPPPAVVAAAPAPAEVPAPEPLAPKPAVKKSKPAYVVVAPRPEAPIDPDALLAEERNLLEVARSALVRGEPKLAVEGLQRHHARFPTGRLAEERESLWIQALIRVGDFDQARAHAKRFREQFPRSLLLPAVDAALSSIPR